MAETDTSTSTSTVPIFHSTSNNDMNHSSATPLPAQTLQLPKGQRPKLEHGTMGRLSVIGDGMNFDIPSNMGTSEHVMQTHGMTSWRMKVLHIIHSKAVEYTLASLLFLDILLLFSELLLLSYYPHCTLVIRDAISCCSSTGSSTNNNNNTFDALENESNSSNVSNSTHEAARHFFFRLLESALNSSTVLEGHAAGSSEEHLHEEICDYPSMVEDMSYPAGCDEHRHSGVHVVEEVLFYLTILILSIFMVELNCAMLALTPSIFFRQFFFALDYFIITVSLVLEITFHALSDTLYQSLSGLLVIFRIWRFVRIGHGIVELTNEAAHREYDKLVVYTKELRTIILQSPNHIVTLPSNFPEMDLFFTNYEQVHDKAEADEGPISAASKATSLDDKVRLSTVPEIEPSE